MTKKGFFFILTLLLIMVGCEGEDSSTPTPVHYTDDVQYQSNGRISYDAQSSTSGKIYYVTQAGTGAGDGSSYTNAMSAISHNNRSFNPGDTIYMCDTIVAPIIIPSSGTTTNSIVYRGDYNGHPGTLDGLYINNYCIDLNYKSYISFTGLTIKHAGTAGIWCNADKLKKSSNILLSNISVYDCHKRGIEIHCGNNITIANCKIGTVTGSNPNGDGIYVGTGDDNSPSTNITISGCTFSGSYGRMAVALTGCEYGTISGNTFSPVSVGLSCIVDLEPNYAQTVSNITLSSNNFDYTLANIYAINAFTPKGGTLSNITIEKNTINAHNTGHGIYLNTISGQCSVDSNVILNIIHGIRFESGPAVYRVSRNYLTGANSNSYLMLISEYSSVTATNNILNKCLVGILVKSGCTGNLYNNTICEFKYQGIRAVGKVVAKNNILCSKWNDHNMIYDDSGQGTYNYNLYYSPNDMLGIFYYSGHYYNTLASWASGTGQNSNSLQSDPLFVSYSIDFHLQPVSPAVNTGCDVLITSDYDGNSIPYGPKPDIGAYELH